jgi:hypothetical protein
MGLIMGTRRVTRVFSAEDEIDDNGEILFESEKDKDQEQLFGGSKATSFAGYSYTIGDHAKYLHLSSKESGYHFCDMTHLFLMDDESESSRVVPNIFKDYVSPVPYEYLKTLYLFLERSFPGTESEPLPIRTLTIRIPPHVKCGSVMDAFHKALISDIDDDNCIILKRQGGHFRLVFRNSSSAPSVVIDAQLCTFKTTTTTGHQGLERRLVLRVYHAIDDQQAMDEIADHLPNNSTSTEIESSSSDDNSTSTEIESSSDDDDDSCGVAFQVNLRLKEASSLLQYLLLAHDDSSSSGDIEKSDSEYVLAPRRSASGTTFYLMDRYQKTESVRKVQNVNDGEARTIVLPALSQEDWSALQASFPILQSICEQLKVRQCIYGTTNVESIDPIEQQRQPSIIDVQYCAQLRQMARAPMLQEVAMVEDDLEALLQIEEAAYRNFFDLLEGTYETYGGVPKPSYIPRPPSELVSPTKSTVPAFSSTVESFYTELAEESVDACDAILAQRLFEVFTKQDNDELRDYVNKKNVQTINRLVQIQSEQRKLGSQLERRGGWSSEKALEFARLVEATNSGDQQEVPLLEFPSTGGRCYVTWSRILFVKKNLIRGPQITLFDLGGGAAVGFEISSESKVTFIEILCEKEIVYCFRPTKLETRHVKGFLDTLKRLLGNDEDVGLVSVDV